MQHIILATVLWLQSAADESETVPMAHLLDAVNHSDRHRDTRVTQGCHCGHDGYGRGHAAIGRKSIWTGLVRAWGGGPGDTGSGLTDTQDSSRSEHTSVLSALHSQAQLFAWITKSGNRRFWNQHTCGLPRNSDAAAVSLRTSGQTLSTNSSRSEHTSVLSALHSKTQLFARISKFGSSKSPSPETEKHQMWFLRGNGGVSLAVVETRIRHRT